MTSKSLILSLVVAMAISVALVAQTGMQQPSSQQPSSQQPMTQQPMSQQPSAMQTGGSDEQQVRALEEQLKASLIKNDTSFLEQHLTSDYVGISGMSGEQISRDRAIQDLRTGKLRYQSIDGKNMTVRSFGNTAIVNGEATVSMVRDGQPMSGDFRYTRVWVKQNGDWKIASFESTREQPPAK